MDMNGLRARPTEAVPAIPASCLYEGEVERNLAASKTLKIETTPDGEELFNAEVPEGKKWEVSVRISIKETEA